MDLVQDTVRGVREKTTLKIKRMWHYTKGGEKKQWSRVMTSLPGMKQSGEKQRRLVCRYFAVEFSNISSDSRASLATISATLDTVLPSFDT